MHKPDIIPSQLEKDLSYSDPDRLPLLSNINPLLSKKLFDGGFTTIEAVASASIRELTSCGNFQENMALKLIEMAQKSLGIDFKSADKVLESRRSMMRLSTGVDALDDLLGGGIETGSVTEVYGEYGTGKTQIAHQLCVTSHLPCERGGITKDGKEAITCIYIDTEGSFRPERIVSMANQYSDDLNIKSILKHILHGRAYNSDHQMILTERIMREAPLRNVKLLIIDSLITHFRAEYVGRETLASRQQKLNQHLHSLLRLAEIYNLAIILTNQVQTAPDTFFGDPTTPVGGHILAHSTHTRIYLRKSKGERRIARIIDSPMLPENEVVFAITTNGLKDVF
ncbi:DNA repair and recombination protein RadA [Candidatus Hodarchaeum mangrovi]